MLLADTVGFKMIIYCCSDSIICSRYCQFWFVDFSFFIVVVVVVNLFDHFMFICCISTKSKVLLSLEIAEDCRLLVDCGPFSFNTVFVLQRP